MANQAPELDIARLKSTDDVFSAPVLPSLDELFMSQRRALGLTLDDIAEFTKIPRRHLEALEAHALHTIPSEIYARYYVRRYAEALDLPLALADACYQRMLATHVGTIQWSAPATPKRLGRFSFSVLPKLVRTILLSLIAIAFAGYIGVRIMHALDKPTLVLNGFPTTTLSPTVSLSGSTNPEATLTINGKQILASPNGNFATNVDLRPGINTITLQASGRYGQSQTRTEHIEYSPTPSDAAGEIRVK